MASTTVTKSAGDGCVIIAFPAKPAGSRPAPPLARPQAGWVPDELGLPAALALATLIVLALCCPGAWLLS